jgi:serine/threonine protein phosphatase PrpC
MTSTGIEPPGPSDAAASDTQATEEAGDCLLEERDYAGRQIQGVRAVQEDSYGVVPRSEFDGGSADLFLVVADGMGGHAAGEVASSLAVHTFAETFLTSGTACDAGRLWDCLEESNRRIAREIDSRGDTVQGMGTTLLAVLLRGRSVRWMSVGDSPLYLIRANEIQRLNQIHSQATELAEQVKAGQITEEQARTDPARHTLLSALVGETIYDVDDPSPVELMPGDVLIAATDGIETLTHQEIAAVCTSMHGSDASVLAGEILQAVESKQSPKQDNTTVVVVRLPG